ncbi:hypothetical protein C8R42DRAFT_772511 [Lentinula raphanica]|nr:hypothetical protein C8R42DRAFT_772511 [Lentinula raphanica]
MFPLIPRTFLLASFFGRTFSQSTSVTLWQFGAHRLAAGGFTAPLRPIGTPGDGPATTYLYEVFDPVTTVATNAGSLVFTTEVFSVSRTIVASASGWIESFGTTSTIQCSFTGSDTGICFDATNTSTGAPTPIVLEVDAAITSAPAEATTTPVLTTSSVTPPRSSKPTIVPTSAISTSISTSTSNSRRSPLGVIIGGAIGGVVIAGIFGFLLFWLLRRQRRSHLLDVENGDRSNPLPYTLTAPTRTEALPSLSSRTGTPRKSQTSTQSSPAETSSKKHFNNRPRRARLKQQAEATREEFRSLQQASLNLPAENVNHEAMISLRGRMAEVLERLGRLEEQTSANERPPSYVC